MVKLLMIADDFTGALDTGIQFAKEGIGTQVFTTQDLENINIKSDTEVIVIDAETRPLSREKAYKIVFDISLWAVKNHINIIFKKTDSALRGNIGAELQAVIDATKETLFFLPQHPNINRITKDGICYISGELLENSVFGKDPFEPVDKSYIPDIIKEQSNIDTVCLKTSDNINDYIGKESLIILDAQTVNDLSNNIDKLINNERLKCIAGCAGLAEQLVKKIKFVSKEYTTYKKTKDMFVACGSLNDITKKQIEYAEKNCGFIRKNLSLEQKLIPEYYKTDDGEKFLEDICKLFEYNNKVIVDTFDLENSNISKEDFINKHNITHNDIRKLIPKCHGIIIKAVLEVRDSITVLMTGGDTLIGFMELIGCIQIEPVCEIEQGTVLSLIEWNGRKYQVISKSGGFGTEDILEKLKNKLLI